MGWTARGLGRIVIAAVLLVAAPGAEAGEGGKAEKYPPGESTNTFDGHEEEKPKGK